MTEEQNKRYMELLASPAGTARLVLELEERLAETEQVSEGRRAQLDRLVSEKNEEWKRAENAEAQNERYKKSIAITDKNFRNLQNDRDRLRTENQKLKDVLDDLTIIADTFEDRPDDATISIGWWDGNEFNARLRYSVRDFKKARLAVHPYQVCSRCQTRSDAFGCGEMCKSTTYVLQHEWVDPFTEKEHCPRRLMGEHQPPHMPCDTGDFSRDRRQYTSVPDGFVQNRTLPK